MMHVKYVASQILMFVWQV